MFYLSLIRIFVFFLAESKTSTNQIFSWISNYREFTVNIQKRTISELK